MGRFRGLFLKNNGKTAKFRIPGAKLLTNKSKWLRTTPLATTTFAVLSARCPLGAPLPPACQHLANARPTLKSKCPLRLENRNDDDERPPTNMRPPTRSWPEFGATAVTDVSCTGFTAPRVDPRRLNEALYLKQQRDNAITWRNTWISCSCPEATISQVATGASCESGATANHFYTFEAFPFSCTCANRR